MGGFALGFGAFEAGFGAAVVGVAVVGVAGTLVVVVVASVVDVGGAVVEVTRGEIVVVVRWLSAVGCEDGSVQAVKQTIVRSGVPRAKTCSQEGRLRCLRADAMSVM